MNNCLWCEAVQPASVANQPSDGTWICPDCLPGFSKETEGHGPWLPPDPAKAWRLSAYARLIRV